MKAPTKYAAPGHQAVVEVVDSVYPKKKRGQEQSCDRVAIRVTTYIPVADEAEARLVFEEFGDVCGAYDVATVHVGRLRAHKRKTKAAKR